MFDVLAIEFDGRPRVVLQRRPTIRKPVDLGYLMQSTGLHDENGKPIFEGDILDTFQYEGGYVECVYNSYDGCFEYKEDTGDLFDTLGGYDGCYKVIGNIYEDYKLLMGASDGHNE